MELKHLHELDYPLIYFLLNFVYSFEQFEEHFGPTKLQNSLDLQIKCILKKFIYIYLVEYLR